MLQTNRGVTTPVNQGAPANEGTANTVVSAHPVEFVAVEFFDGEGRRRKDVLMKLGDEFYTPPNSQVWAESLKRVQPWLRDGTRKKMPTSGPVPTQDDVDIIP